MKRIVFILLCILTAVLFSLSLLAEDTETVTLDSVRISEDGKSLTVKATLTETFASHNQKVYLFRVTPDNESIHHLAPIAELDAVSGEAVFTLPYHAEDYASALYGYVLANCTENGAYQPLSKAVYVTNLAEHAENTKAYPVITSKKGLEVQYVADAQLLGVKHSVVHAFFNDLITEDEENSEGFIYGGNRYYINKQALAALDYRIKSLSDAGIHIYLNLLLSYDPSAPAELYYPNIKGTTGILYAPNVSTPDGVRRFAAVIHFLAERYTREDGKYGFCGSYILGYEVNHEAEKNNTALHDFDTYTSAYATLLRVADIAVHTAYCDARLFVSLSNRWTVEKDGKVGLFGGKEFLQKLTSLCSDIPFGVSVNPYPSSLTQTAYWNDEKASNDPDTEYLTMKNISVLSDFLQNDAMRHNGKARPILVGEFGLSGKKGDTSEDLQAAAYIYAYDTVCNDPLIEAMIWHRHVDHASEVELHYGLFAASDLLLEAVSEKTIHRVFTAIDTVGEDNRELIESFLSYLPIDDFSSLYGEDTTSTNRIVYSISEYSSKLSSTRWKKRTLFDFDKSLYDFYPTDNAEYLELHEANGSSFLRTSILSLSALEYGGIGIKLSDISQLCDADYITLRLRVNAKTPLADIRMLISGTEGESTILLDATASVSSGEWADVTFSLDALKEVMLSEAALKIWVRTDAAKGKTVLLDVASVLLHSEKNMAPMILFLIFLGMAFLAALSLGGVFIIHRMKKPSVK